jgi:hypothetical protein
MEFGEKCINCRFFKLNREKLIFGKCEHPVPVSAAKLGSVHMFSSCSKFEVMPQHLRPVPARRIDFELERKAQGWDKFVSK